jgi:hypothetical protein
MNAEAIVSNIPETTKRRLSHGGSFGLFFRATAPQRKYAPPQKALRVWNQTKRVVQ